MQTTTISKWINGVYASTTAEAKRAAEVTATRLYPDALVTEATASRKYRHRNVYDVHVIVTVVQ
jgi:uncharacterized protein YqiB (DUF1249 family)